MSSDRDNPRWHYWPFKGWREDDAAFVVGLVLFFFAFAAGLWWARS